MGQVSLDSLHSAKKPLMRVGRSLPRYTGPGLLQYHSPPADIHRGIAHQERKTERTSRESPAYSKEAVLCVSGTSCTLGDNICVTRLRR